MANVDLMALALRAQELYEAGRASEPEFKRSLTSEECDALWQHVEDQLQPEHIATVKEFFDSRRGEEGKHVFGAWKLRDLYGRVPIMHIAFEGLAAKDKTMKAIDHQHLFLKPVLPVRNPSTT